MITMAIDYKEKYFDEKFKSLDQSIGSIANDLRANTELTKEVKAQAERTNGRVTRLEEWRKAFKTGDNIKEKDLPAAWRDPKFIGLVFNFSLIILIIVATLAGINVTSILP